MPLIEGNIVQSMSGTIITDNAVSLRLTIKETPGVSAIPALQAPDTTPTGFDSFESMPILDLPLSWDGMQFGVSRPGNYTRSGLADLYQLKGDRPLQTGELTFAQLSRAEVFKLIRFFESRRGRLYPWLLAPPATDLTATAIGTTSVTVTAVGPERDWDFFPHVAIVLWDGTVYVREISGVARGAGSDVITLADAIPAVLLSAVKRVATGLKARFDTDEMVENWITDQIATCKLKIHEDIAEAVTINVPDPRTGIEKPASNPGGEATPGDPPDAEVLIRLRDFCTNQLTNLCVPAATFDEATTIYNPSDGNVYTVGLSDTLTECPGSTLAGWQVLPADPEDWPSWIGSSAPTTAIISGLIDSVACPDTCWPTTSETEA